jgi:hypothetical protein
VGATRGRFEGSDLTRQALQERTKKLLRLFGRMVLRVDFEDRDGIQRIVPKCVSLVVRKVASDWGSHARLHDALGRFPRP